ncbi:unnamed protein product, partial [Onchocerca flexuosa]|uniref:Uncharacterized protein n=1 Tax=Onchocerca flexuosa TaxID=387005 RepID=A0A183HTN7_9BILA
MGNVPSLFHGNNGFDGPFEKSSQANRSIGPPPISSSKDRERNDPTVFLIKRLASSTASTVLYPSHANPKETRDQRLQKSNDNSTFPISTLLTSHAPRIASPHFLPQSDTKFIYKRIIFDKALDRIFKWTISICSTLVRNPRMYSQILRNPRMYSQILRNPRIYSQILRNPRMYSQILRNPRMYSQ